MFIATEYLNTNDNMEYFLTNFGGYVAVATMVIVGVFAVIGVVNKKSRELRKTEVDTADSVIDLLSKKVEVLEGKVGELGSKEVRDVYRYGVSKIGRASCRERV